MKVASSFVTLAAVVVATPALAIVNGEPDTENLFPSVGALVAVEEIPAFPDLRVPQSFCSGTLIHPRVFLTAGHCVEFAAAIGLTPEKMRVTFSPNAHLTPDEDPLSFEIEEFIFHPDFVTQPSGAAPEHYVDVAVAILKTPVEGISPVALPPVVHFLDKLRSSGALGQGPDGGTPLWIAGYGYVFEFPPPQTEFLVIPQGFRHRAITEYRALRRPYLLANQTAAQGIGGGSDGDSGGPVFFDDDGKLVQVGIFSAADSVDVSLGVYSRLDRLEVLFFLEEVIQRCGGESN